MLSYGNTIPRILLSGMLRKTFRIDELQFCSDVEVLVCNAVKMFKCWRPKKNRRGLTQTESISKKFFPKSQCSNRKIGVDRSRESKKGWPLQRQVSFKSLFPRLATYLLLTRGAVDATPFAVAFSLTFSLVKNLKMLLQAKRQPGQKMLGRVADRAYQMTRVTKIGYEKLKDKT